MRQRPRELLSQGEALFAKRNPLLSLWQQSCENFHVMRADFTRVRYFSEEFASYLMTGRPALAHRDLTNSLPAMMRPRDRQWLWARTHDKRINEDREARAYLDWLSETQFRAMYDPRAAMVRSTKEADGDYCAIGNAVLTVDPNEWGDGLLIRCWHPRDVVWTEGHDLKINQVHHRRKISVRDLIKLFRGNVAQVVTDALQKEPDREINCQRIIIPSGEYDLPVKNKARTPFVSIYIDVENETILEEKAVRTPSYVIPRWATVSGSQYAYSPATVYGLPDARMLQQITLTMLEAGQKATDPPLKAVTEAIAGGVNSGAGMITWVDADYDERTGPALEHLIQKYDGVQYGAQREDKITGMLDATFFLNQIRMPQVTKDMTAYEASKLYEEFTRQSLPLLEPIEVEYNGGLCSAGFEVMQSLNLFGSPHDMPPILRGQELRWDFDTPLKAAAETAKVFAFSQAVDIIAKGTQIDPSVAINFDANKGARDALIGAGAADWIVPEDQVAALKQKQEQAAQMAGAASAMAHGADAATKVATAVKSGAEASQAVQAGGMPTTAPSGPISRAMQ